MADLMAGHSHDVIANGRAGLQGRVPSNAVKSGERRNETRETSSTSARWSSAHDALWQIKSFALAQLRLGYRAGATLGMEPEEWVERWTFIQDACDFARTKITQLELK